MSGSHAEVGELAGIDVVAFIDVQAADRLHAGRVIGVGEKLIAIGVIAPDNGCRAVKLQRDEPLCERTVIRAAAGEHGKRQHKRKKQAYKFFLFHYVSS